MNCIQLNCRWQIEIDRCMQFINWLKIGRVSKYFAVYQASYEENKLSHFAHDQHQKQLANEK